MVSQDFKFLTEMSQALYSDKTIARARCLEIVALISVNKLSERSNTLPSSVMKHHSVSASPSSESLIKAARMLMYRSEKEGLSATSSGLNYPYYRLTVFERVVLMMLHSKKCSYKECSELLGLSTVEVEKIAWHARLKLSSQPEIRSETLHPPGVERGKHSCPEFFNEHPWTQKLLDDEMKPMELSYIQNHLLLCRSCARSLDSTRKFYYAIEKWIPLFTNESDFKGELMELRRSQIEAGLIPKDLTVGEGLRIFFSRTEVIVSLTLLVGLILFRVFYFV